MILLDTSLLIDYLRSKDSGLLSRFESLDAAICGITRAEILCGARDDAHRELLKEAMDVMHQVLIPDSFWDQVGHTLSTLRRAGITVPFTDAVIATVAMAGGLELWTRDQQFELIRGVMPQLALFHESA